VSEDPAGDEHSASWWKDFDKRIVLGLKRALEQMGITKLADQKFVIGIATELEKIGKQIEELSQEAGRQLEPVGRSLTEHAEYFGRAAEPPWRT